MKLVEIKNSLAKLYYQPEAFPLVLSDFLTVDDENQKILSQVVSIESTNKSDTNCAILKFSLDLDENNYTAYSGYAPALDAKVSKTEPTTLNSIFSSASNSFCIGELTGSSNLTLSVRSDILDKLLYIQSDKIEDSQELTDKILNYNLSSSRKTVVFDTDGVKDYENAKILELGQDFKLPIDNEILNYIYENDLTGLTVEQKTIVQDIILEIQDYIETIESGYIPFNTLLNVVNGIYESDKSVGIILLRNKLLKYNQFGIFASTEEEIQSLYSSVEENTLTVLKVKNTNINWQKKVLDFIVNNLKSNIYLVMDIDDEIMDKEILNKLYKSANLKPIVSSKYDSIHSSQLKSFAKNLIMFRPEEQQRAFATYNSFLNKLSQGEFIVSGETTFFTPLIVKRIIEKFEDTKIEQAAPPEINFFEAATAEEPIAQEIHEQEPLSIESEALQDELVQEEFEIEPLEEIIEDESELKNIFEESLEEEIAKDVDQMFYAEASLAKEQQEEITIEEPSDEAINYEDMFSDDDLDMLDELNTEGEISENIFEENEAVEPFEIPSSFNDLPTFEEESFENESISVLENLTENESLPSIPIYTTELDNNNKSDDTIKIAEGNIVYHQKYGRGVVEQLILYGKKTLCSIQFDNVGRRLLDPNLADLKQM